MISASTNLVEHLDRVLSIDVSLQLDNGKTVQTKALIDSGATNDFIHSDFARAHNVPLTKKPAPVDLEVIDGRRLPKVALETAPVRLSIGNHSESIMLNVIDSPRFPIILGMTWLSRHNPNINWTRRTMEITRVTQDAAREQSEPKEAITALTLHDTDVFPQQPDPPPQDLSPPPRHERRSRARVDSGKAPYAVPLPGDWNQAQCLKRWHHRLGHRNLRDVILMANHDLTESMEILAQKVDKFCEGCTVAKAKERPFPSESKDKEWNVLERIDVDECGPLPVASLNGERYFITFTEFATRMKFTFLLHHKNEALTKFKELKARIENRLEKSIKILFGDNDGVFINDEFKALLQECGIEWRSTVEYSSKQNGVSERGHLTLMDSGRAMLVHARLPKQFWGPAILTASHVHNLCPHPRDPTTTPHEKLSRSKPDIRYLRTFGCDAYGYVPSSQRTKLDPRAVKGIFIGYADHQKGYVLYHPSSGLIKVYRSVTFNEDSFGGRSADDALADPDEPESEYDGNYVPSDDESAVEGAQLAGPSEDPLSPIQRARRTPRKPDRLGDPVHHAWIASLQPTHDAPIHHMWIGSTHQCEDDDGATPSAEDPDTPTTYEDAMASPEAEFWTKAMTDELNSLTEHKTWEAIERLPVGARPIGCRWVYKRKIMKTSQVPPDSTWVLRHDPDGVTTHRYKARLCILGYKQREGVDYTKTYAPVIRSDILRLVLALSVHDKEIIAEQMDVMTAFLNAYLTEEIYMDSPKGSKARTRFVKLLRSIYGLKQAPREWFKVIDAFLVNECGFQRAKSASCLYFKRSPTGRLVVVGVYVDDIPIVGHPELVHETKSSLSRRFKMSDMGELQSVIGLDVDRQGGSVFLSQERYTKTIIDTYGMAESRPVSTPADANLKLSTSLCPQNQADRELVALEGQRINYRAAVGHLMWLLHTRPDIAYAVNEVSRYVQDPGPAHFVALKRIFRYLNGTRNYGLLFEGGGEATTPFLVGYSDSDWAGDVDSRRSTSGYVFLLNGCPVSFRSKKQTTVALSSCEAETVASTLAATEGVWLRNVLDELGFPQAQPTLLNVDNQGAIAFANSEINHSKMKHLALKDHFVRELVASNLIKVHYVRSSDNLADIFTKPLGKVKFVEFRQALKCVPRPDRIPNSSVEGANQDTVATSSSQSVAESVAEFVAD